MRLIPWVLALGLLAAVAPADAQRRPRRHRDAGVAMVVTKPDAGGQPLQSPMPVVVSTPPPAEASAAALGSCVMCGALVGVPGMLVTLVAWLLISRYRAHQEEERMHTAAVRAMISGATHGHAYPLHAHMITAAPPTEVACAYCGVLTSKTQQACRKCGAPLVGR